MHLKTSVADIRNKKNKVVVVTSDGEERIFDYAIISTGHRWALKREGKTSNFFDSPYPPAKLAKRINGAIAIRGSSLKAVDAVSTLARSNGNFTK
ncbi:hypothetical protein BH10CYA1_BH10CYA1_54680 [soil metagenome]